MLCCGLMSLCCELMFAFLIALCCALLGHRSLQVQKQIKSQKQAINSDSFFYELLKYVMP